MSNPKHTPGPWTVETYHGSMFKICKPDFKIGNEVTHRLEADRRLIAAAPELLEALCAVRELMLEHKVPVLEWNKDAFALMRNAIAKATGGAE